MKTFTGLAVLLAATLLFLPDEVFARGFGGGGGGGGFGGGGGARVGGGGGARPNFGGGGASRPESGGGGGVRPNMGNVANHSPSFSHPTGGGSARPNPGVGDRPQIGGGNRPGIGGGAGNRANIGGGIGNTNNIGNRTNVGRIGNNNFNNVHNNINIASNRPYYNNWQHGNWNGNWNRPGGGGYWNGWAHGYNAGYWHGGWGGYWHGGGGYWGRPWYAAPIAWGLGAWALGSVMYNSGYASYSNPYYSDGGGAPAYYDYSQPIPVTNQQPDAAAQVASTDGDPAVAAANAKPPSPEVQEGTTHMDLARDAFQKGDYAAASREIDLAIKALPKDAALHEFRALIFFATKNYKQAAATLYAVLAAGPGWDWTTLSSMYASTAKYTDQLRDLEQYVKANSSAADARFVLAYHYLTCKHTDAARQQYEEVLKLQPNDQLSAQLLKLVGGDPSETAAGQPTPEPPDADSSGDNPEAPRDIDASKIVGKWTAKRANGPTFTMNLTKDSKFTWGYQQGTKREEFGGKYSVDGAVLVLERTDGAQMPGLVTLANNGFNFKLYGGAPDDPGLDFKK